MSLPLEGWWMPRGGRRARWPATKIDVEMPGGQVAEQQEMCRAVAKAGPPGRSGGPGIRDWQFLADWSRSRCQTAVATATRCCKTSRAKVTLPMVEGLNLGLGSLDYAVPKGRSNYIRRERVAEVVGRDPAELGDEGPSRPTSARDAWADEDMVWKCSATRGPRPGAHRSRWSKEPPPTGDASPVSFQPSSGLGHLASVGA